ncbi:MAG: hypothetical protein ACJA13_004040 [Paraglaciecola sp.]|jgi:hypothetical protein
MQVQNTRLSLFDYIGNSTKSESALNESVAMQQNDLAGEIRGMQGNLAVGNVDDALDRLHSGENGLSLQTLDNMLSFNLRPVANDLQQTAVDLGLNVDVQLQQQDSKWQVISDQDPQPKGLQQLQSYLDRNQGLQTKLNSLNALSEFYELGQSQEYAKELQAADVDEDDVVTYLTQSREYLFSLDSFYVSDKGLSIASRGESNALFEDVKKTLGLQTTE